jgi:hypothetical protein
LLGDWLVEPHLGSHLGNCLWRNVFLGAADQDVDRVAWQALDDYEGCQ